MSAEQRGVHETHCCPVHGCKYGDADCPVTLGAASPRYSNNNGCEHCELPSEADRAPDEREVALARAVHKVVGYVPAGWHDMIRLLGHPDIREQAAAALEAVLPDVADRARAEVQAAVLALVEDAERGEGIVLFPGHREYHTVDTGLLRAALSDTAALDRMLAEAWLEGSAHAESRGGHFPEDDPYSKSAYVPENDDKETA